MECRNSVGDQTLIFGVSNFASENEFSLRENKGW